jgi:hypothetical protein
MDKGVLAMVTMRTAARTPSLITAWPRGTVYQSQLALALTAV